VSTVNVNEEVNFEKKRSLAVSLFDGSEEDPCYCVYFSKYLKVLQKVAWIRRFASNAKKPEERNRGELTATGVNESERLLVRAVQQESFSDDRKLNLNL